MKHTIELKMPKLFKKKVQQPITEEPVIKTEVEFEDIKEAIEQKIDFDKIKNNIKKIAVPVAVGVAGLTIGHLAGFKAGVIKGLDGKIIVIK